MDRIDTPGATAGQLFQNGNPFLGILGTILGAKWANGVQEEIVRTIEAAGITPSDTVVNQLLQAIQVLTGGDATTPSVASGAGLFPSAASGLPIQGQREAVVLARGSGDWIAGNTPVAPTAGNTFAPNEYVGGVYPGNLWPWMTLGLNQVGIGAATGGTFPGAIAGSGVNFYRNGGFVLPEKALTNGGALEVVLTGDVQTTVATRQLEFSVDLDLDPNAAFDATKSFAWQTGVLPSTGGALELFESRTRITAGGYDAAGSDWLFGVVGRFFVGNSATASLTASGRRVFRVVTPDSTLDLLEDLVGCVRWKTDDNGSTLGDSGNSSGSDQTGSEITARVRNFQVLLYPGSF